MIGCSATGADPAGALLHQAKRGTALLVEGRNLAIDDCALSAEVLRKRLQLGKLSSEFVAVA